jgi:NADH-quinone oxidoreductase subunit A
MTFAPPDPGAWTALAGATLAAGDRVADYVPVLLMFLFAIGFAVGILLLSFVLGKKAPGNPVKDAAYECGMPPVTDAHQRFSVKFYLVALLFVIFDIEVVFLYPWAVHFQQQPVFLLVEMVVFIAILFLGWFYVVRKGAVNWSRE